MRVVLTGGGTGGHLFPALAIAEALRLRRPGVEVLFVGGDRLESRIVPQEGWPFRRVASRGLPRRASPAAVAALAINLLGMVQAVRLLRQWRPGAVVATGGYVSAPVGMAAVLLGIPLVVQEQNLRPGLASRLLARWARWVSLPSPGAATGLRAAAAEVTGVPLRARALEGNRHRGLERWGLEADRLTILALGGSQGAGSLNRAVCRMADLLMYEARLQILHQTGTGDLSGVREAIGHREHVGPPLLRHVAVPFLEAIGDAYACADIVVCRAGASTLAEVTAWGLPAVLSPYPHAAEGHQEENARRLVEAGAAVRVADADLVGMALVEAVQDLVRDAPRRAAMAAASRAVGRPEAAGVVADRILALIARAAAQESAA